MPKQSNQKCARYPHHQVRASGVKPKGEIEEIRGVSISSTTMKTLLEYGWIKIAGYKNVPGKPPIYVTTNKFLEYFNLESLQQLPPLPENITENHLANVAVTQLDLSLTESEPNN